MRIFVGSADSNCAQHTEGFIGLCYLSPHISGPLRLELKTYVNDARVTNYAPKSL